MDLRVGGTGRSINIAIIFSLLVDTVQLLEHILFQNVRVIYLGVAAVERYRSSSNVTLDRRICYLVQHLR